MKPLLDKHWWHRYNVYPITIYVFGLGDSMTAIHVNSCKHQEEFKDTKEVIKIRKSKKDRQHNGHGNRRRTNNTMAMANRRRTKGQQRSIKHYTEN
jgi:hypothetical protein